MRFADHFVTPRRLLALVGLVAIGACSGDATGIPTLSPNSASGLSNSGTPASDTTLGGSPGEWHLKTIRGIVLGAHSMVNADTSEFASNPIAGAKVEIHKIDLTPTTSTGGDSASRRFKDLGIVATVTADASGRFQYVLDDPIVVKSGQASPSTTYHLTITPPAGSAFPATSDVQVLFMEQLPASWDAVNYYLFAPTK
jgi:hypothetical protein